MSQGWSVRTRDGRVTVELPSGFAAELDAHTGDGRIHADLESSGGNTRRGIRDRRERRDFTARLGQGGRLFTIRTGDGSVSIRQRRML